MSAAPPASAATAVLPAGPHPDLAFDPGSPEVIADPYPSYARLRAEAPALHLPAYDAWIVTRYRDVREAVRDPARFSSRIGMSPDFAPDPRLSTGVHFRVGAPGVRVLLALDPPEHHMFRRIVSAAFSPAAIGRLSEVVTELARERVGELVERSAAGSADFFRDVAEPLPVLALAHLFGVPRSMHEEFREWSCVATAGLQPGSPAGALGSGIDMFRYFSRELRRRGDDRGPGLLGALADARGAGLSDNELLAFCAFLLVAGIETTTNLLTNLVAALVRYPDEQRRLRADPRLVDAATEEGIRYDSPIQGLWRGTTEDVALGDVTIPAGARVLVMFGSANHDGEVFARSEEFSLERETNDHMGFGYGPHFCLGARLARMEVRAVLGELLARTKDFDLAGEGTRTQSFVFRGYTSQPLHVLPA